jgi:hypothetical protein
MGKYGDGLPVQTFESFKKAIAQKNSDGSWTVRVFSSPDRSTDVLFPMDPWNEKLAREYEKFKNEQSGPNSLETKAVLGDLRGMEAHDRHEQLMEKATLVPDTATRKLFSSNFPLEGSPSRGSADRNLTDEELGDLEGK